MVISSPSARGHSDKRALERKGKMLGRRHLGGDGLGPGDSPKEVWLRPACPAGEHPAVEGDHSEIGRASAQWKNSVEVIVRSQSNNRKAFCLGHDGSTSACLSLWMDCRTKTLHSIKMASG